ncbi:MAG: glycoside hydrolase family 3 protein, partial [Candidatus Dormibacteraeota bacterium]|nr:glycoside hydrolase family 3 protein [Candidatus Dormibacteraeota bacterium]
MSVAQRQSQGSRRRTLLSAPLVIAAAAAALAGGMFSPARVAAQTTTSCAPNNGMPWMNTSEDPATRATQLLSVMTQAEKDQLLVGTGDPTTSGAADMIAAQPSLCIPPLIFNDGGEGISDDQQLYTAYPASVSDAAMWDPSLDNTFGQSIGSEAFQKDVNVWLAPGMDIGRIPMDGRNYEYSGEDPYLAGTTAAAVSHGVQSQNVIATLKHYAANDQETNRQTVSAQVDERTLQEIDLPAYDIAVQGGNGAGPTGAGAVMCGYNRINTIYACENPDTLTNDLKNEFGFSGFVMSDWGGTHSTVNAANAGLDQEHPSSTHLGTALETAVTNGQVSQARFDNMAYRVLYSMFRIGLFDNPIPAPTAPVATNVDTSAAQAVSQ